MKNYFDITVVISPGTDGTFAVRVASEHCGQANSILKLPFNLRDLSGVVFGVAQTARDIGSVTPQETGPGAMGATMDPRSAEDFGVELFKALFRGDARDLLVTTETMAQLSKEEAGVRIRLSMDLQALGMGEVASLPWELMCRKKGEDPLVLSNQTTLVRALDVYGITEPRQFRAPLRIMVVMSNPKGTGALDLGKERTLIEQSWGGRRDVQVDFVRPIEDDVRKQLRAADYHVVHYMGHGDFDADGRGLLLLEDEIGNPVQVTGEDFARWLKDEPLRLVFLNACKTGTTSVRSGAHPFAGVATALIKAKVPAVVAMQFPISDQAAILFAQTFYEGILNGLPVDAAVVGGRAELRSNRKTASEWATPVLYLRSKDAMLFEWVNNDVAMASAVPLGRVQSVAATTHSTDEDPWGAGAAEMLRVFLATPDQDRERLHGQLSKALQAIDGVRVVDSVPLDDEKHNEVAGGLIRRADLCVHLLGANAGRRLDVDDGQPLRTYPLVQLEIGCKLARSQLVIITSEDKESIGNAKYAARVDELAKLHRDTAQFELVITDKNRIMDAIRAKLEALKKARQTALTPSAPDGTVRAAYVDSHDVDQDRAEELVTFLGERNVEAFMQTSEGSATDGLAQFSDNLRKYPLYIVVAGRADEAWVKYRTNAARRSAVEARAAILIGKYEGADDVEITASRIKIVAALKRVAPDPVDALFAPAAGDNA